MISYLELFLNLQNLKTPKKILKIILIVFKNLIAKKPKYLKDSALEYYILMFKIKKKIRISKKWN